MKSLKGLFSKGSKILNGFGTITLVFSSLSAISSLESFNDIINFLRSLGSDIVAIMQFFGRIIDTILTPYRWIANQLFSILPIEIPVEWHDSIVLGLMIFLYPYKELRFKNQFDKLYDYPKLGGKIRELISVMPKKKEYESVNVELMQLIGSGDKYFRDIMFRKSGSYLYSLKNPKSKKDVNMKRKRLLAFYDKSIYPIIEEIPILPQQKSISFYRKKALIAFVILVLITIDTLFVTKDFTFIIVFFKLILSIVMVGILPVLLLFVPALLYELIREPAAKFVFKLQKRKYKQTSNTIMEDFYYELQDFFFPIELYEDDIWFKDLHNVLVKSSRPQVSK